MSGHENHEGEQFKLVSLEGGNSVAGRTKQAYSSYLNPDGSERSSIQLNESVNEPPPAAPVQKSPTKPLPKEPPKQEAPKAPPKSVVNKLSTGNLSNQHIQENIQDVGEKIEELKETISVLWSNFLSTVSAIFIKVMALVVKPFVKIAGILAKILSIPLRMANKLISSFAEKLGNKVHTESKSNEVEEVVEEAPAQIKYSTFSEMIELNIVFTDNYKKNLYNKTASPGFKLSKMEEGLIMGIAIEAIKECAEFTVELPPPSSGIYEGIPVSRVMEEVTEKDVCIFLGFVKAFPGKYIGKTWKISETFATWLINNSPTG